MPPFFAYLDGSTQKWKRNIAQKKSFTQCRVENENIQNTIAYEKTTNRIQKFFNQFSQKLLTFTYVEFIILCEGETFAHFFVLRVFRNDVWCPFNPVFTNELLLLQSSPHCVVRFGGRMGKLRRAMPSVRFRPFPLLPHRQIYLFLRRLAKGVNYDRNETLQEKSYLQRQKHG